jgi:hypothetical protein
VLLNMLKRKKVRWHFATGLKISATLKYYTSERRLELERVG